MNWKAINGYENLYEISDNGQVQSLHNGEKIILKQSVGSKGYNLVTLCKNGKQKTVNVHRLVALAFVPNPNNHPCVNHIDENKKNNEAKNLEWCTHYYNNIYGKRLTKSSLKRSIPVKCIETGIIYSSAYSAQRETGVRQSGICSCCRGKRKTAGGFHWKYA